METASVCIFVTSTVGRVLFFFFTHNTKKAMAFSSDDCEINRHQNPVHFILPSDSGEFVFNKKSKKTNENNSNAVKKSLMKNLTPSDESNKKKKRFSIQKFSQIEEKTNLTLADLPLVPLSYICTNLNVTERDKFR